MAEPYQSPTLGARRAQMFPVLADEEIARLRRFGAPRRYADGECLFETGKTSPGMFVVLSGTLRITGRDGHGHDLLIAELTAGGFSGEIGQLSGRRALADGVAAGAVEALLVVPEQLRALLVAEADLGEEIMRALILRRVGLIEMGAGGPVLIGAASSPDMARLRSFLTRNGIPHLVFDPASDPDAHGFVERYAPRPEDLPLVACPDGSVLRNPAENELARCIGMLDAADADRVHDVAVVGAGQALAGRAYTQAQKFGARMLIPAEAVRLDCGRPEERDPLALELAGARSVRSRTVVVATGARYRRPDCADLKALEGRGVWYWASPIEAKICAGQEVALVGGGNSAGQAAVFLAGHASKVWLLVRGAGLAASMSKYLIERIAGIANIELRTRTEVIGLSGERESGVESVTWRNRDTKQKETRPICHVFMFLGADPTTEWLKDCDVAVDDKGFVTIGNVSRLPLETSVPGVFAIGDVRAGSVKRVGGAIGEGAAAVAQIHAFLARQGATAMVVEAAP